MRIWSVHPKYLDAKGLVALWRETLLAKHVLEGRTKGYTNHPQLIRFKQTANPVGYIHQYLKTVFEESQQRGYHFDPSKFDTVEELPKIPLNRGQLEYEQQHLLKKLKERAPEQYQKACGLEFWECHPLFELKEGGIESWEIL